MHSKKLINFLATILVLSTVAVLIFLTLNKEDPKNESEISSSAPTNTVAPNVSGSDTTGADTSSDESSADISTAESSEASEDTVSYPDYLIHIAPYWDYITADGDEYKILVNQTNLLESNFVPADLVDCGYTRKDGRDVQKVRKTVAEALEAFMMEAAAAKNIKNVTVTSAYRSYSYQNWLFNDYVEQNLSKYATRAECEAYVLTFSMKAGMSEHQTGLCVDMHNLSAANVSFGNTEEGKWLAENAHRFGFILRFPQNKTSITKVQYEPWHFRFVGLEAAAEIHESGLCFEEYHDNQ